MKKVIAIILIIKYLLVSLFFMDFDCKLLPYSLLINIPQLSIELLFLFNLNRELISRALTLVNIININFIPYISFTFLINGIFKIEHGTETFLEAFPFLLSILIATFFVVCINYYIKCFDRNENFQSQGFMTFISNIFRRLYRKDIGVVIFSTIVFIASVIVKSFYYADPYAGGNIKYLLFNSYSDYILLLLVLFLSLVCRIKTLYPLLIITNVLFCFLSFIHTDDRLMSLYYMKNYVIMSYSIKALFIGYLAWRMILTSHMNQQKK